MLTLVTDTLPVLSIPLQNHIFTHSELSQKIQKLSQMSQGCLKITNIVSKLSESAKNGFLKRYGTQALRILQVPSGHLETTVSPTESRATAIWELAAEGPTLRGTRWWL